MRDALRTIISDSMTQHPQVTLRSLQTLPARAGLESAHIDAPIALSDAWLRQRRQYFPHLVRVGLALDRAEAVLLTGWEAARTDAGVYAVLRCLLAEPGRRALLVVDETHAALAAYQVCARWCAALTVGDAPRVAVVDAPIPPDDVEVMIVTVAHLHAVILPQHDAAWRDMWQHIAVVTLFDLAESDGVGLAHLRWIVRRLERIRVFHRAPRYALVLTSTPGTNAAAAASAVVGAPVTVIPVDDVPTPATLAVDIDGAADPYAFAGTLTAALVQASYRVHVVCAPLVALQHWPAGLGAATCDTRLQAADVVVCVGLPADAWLMSAAVLSGAHAVIHIRDMSPATAWSETFPIATLPTWCWPTANAYVDTLHLQAAAAEIPLLPREVADWGVAAIVARLVAQTYLKTIAGDALMPGPHAPELEFEIHHAVGAAAQIVVESHPALPELAISAYDRWSVPGSTIPAWGQGAVVTAVDGPLGVVTVRLDGTPPASIPVRRCSVRVVDGFDPAARSGRGRVAVAEQVAGVLHWEGHTPAARVDLSTDAMPTHEWYAPAWWWQVESLPSADHPWLGWSLLHALAATFPLARTGLVPCYDPARGLLCLVETQPGGAGIVENPASDSALAAAMETAQAWGTAATGDPWLAPFARADARWLGAATVPAAREPFSPDHDAPAAEDSHSETGTEPVHAPDVQTDQPPVEVVGVAHAVPTDDTAQLRTLLEREVTQVHRTTAVAEVPAWLRVVQWVRAQWDAWRGTPVAAVFLPGDSVVVVPYGRGVVVAVEDDGTVVVATAAYGDVRVDPRQDMIERLE